MIHKRERIATAVLVLVMVVIPVAGILQFLIVRSAAGADRVRLNRYLSGVTRQLRSDLALELAGLVAIATQSSRSTNDVATAEHFLREWRALANHPDLVSAVDVTELPEAHDGVFVTAEPGAVVVMGSRSIEVSLDIDYIAQTMAPLLISTHLGSDGPFHAAVYDSDGGNYVYVHAGVTVPAFPIEDLLTRDGKVDATIHPRPDEIIPLSGSAHDDMALFEGEPGPLVSQWLAIRSFTLQFEPGQIQIRPAPYPGRRSAGGPYLIVWHEAGSIDAAVRSEFVRTIMVSWGALLLFGGVALVFYTLYRRALRQQRREQEFVASVTHELRTPVSAMYAAAENLSQGIVTAPDRIREYGDALLAEGGRLRAMIDQTLIYSGLHGSYRSSNARVDVDEIIERSTERATVDPDRLELEIVEPVPPFPVDKTALESIVGNLVENAFKHNPPSTRVVVHVRAVEQRGRFWLELAVSDDGDGIPKSELGKVRAAFYRGEATRDRQTSGTGLGLNIADRVASFHGGTLSIRSIEGNGTTITVSLPYQRP